MGYMMNDTIFIVKGLCRGVGYYMEFDNVIDAMNYYEELNLLHIDGEVELLKVETLAKKGDYNFE